MDVVTIFHFHEDGGIVPLDSKVEHGGYAMRYGSIVLGIIYNVHRPPVGTRIPISDIAPYLYEVDFEYYSGMNTRTYYVDSYANFYVQVNSYELQVVNAPDGAVLYDMPSDYKELVYDGSVYYVIGNSIFEYVYSNANSWYFRAVGIYR